MLGLFWGERPDRGSDRGRDRRAGRRGPSVRRGLRPEIEGLEGRIVLATDIWTGAVSGSWMTAGNWSGGVAPAPNDDLVFPATAANLTNTNDFPGGTTFNSITIQGAGYNLSGNTLNLNTGITASFSTGTSTDAIDTVLTAIVAPITVNRGGTLDVSGVLSGAAGINLTGGGVLDLLGLNKYTGPSTIGSGTTLLVDGTTAGVQDNGGLLAGNGSVAGIGSVGGTIFPGHPATATVTTPSPGQLTNNGSLTLDGSSTFAALLNGTSPGNGVTGYSQLIVGSGTISLGGAKLGAALGTSYTPTIGDQLRIILNNTGTPILGNFAGLPEGAGVGVGNSLFRISYLGTNGTGHDVVLSKVAATTSTAILPVQLPTSPNQPFTLSAQVTGTQGAPTGTVAFFNGNPTSGGVVIASGSLTAVNGSTSVATANAAGLGSGSSPVLYAVYIPTPTSFTYAGSTSAPISFGTTTTLTSSSPVALIGQPITFTATVTPSSAGAGTPAGSVQFIVDNAAIVGTVPINPATGQASLTTSSIGIGTHTVVAQFIATPPFLNSTSSTLTQSISTAGTVPTLTLQPILNRQGKVFKFNLVANVQSTVSAGVEPTGLVTFFINGRAFYRTVALTNGTAVLPRAWQRLVNQYAFVRYNGNGTFVASVSEQLYISHRLLTRLANQAQSSGGRGGAAGRVRLVRSHEAR